MARVVVGMCATRSPRFHKAAAKYFILTSVFCHATAHYFNYAAAPLYHAELGAHVYSASPTEMAWGPGAPGASSGLAPGFTGELLLLCMLVIYAGAHERVKRQHYETFWCGRRAFVGPPRGPRMSRRMMHR